MIEALFVIIGWLMVIIGLAIALAFPHLEGERTLISNLTSWAIPLAGLFLILFSNKIFGNGK